MPQLLNDCKQVIGQMDGLQFLLQIHERVPHLKQVLDWQCTYDACFNRIVANFQRKEKGSEALLAELCRNGPLPSSLQLMGNALPQKYMGPLLKNPHLNCITLMYWKEGTLRGTAFQFTRSTSVFKK